MTFDPTRPAQPEPFVPVQPESSSIPTESVATPVSPTWSSPVSPSPVIPVTPVVTTRRKSSGGWLNVVLVIAAIFAVGGVAFAVGRSTAPASAAVFPGGGFGNAGQLPLGSGAIPSGFAGRGGQGGPGGFFAGGPTLSGTVESITDDTMTIKTDTGQTIEVKLDSDTSYGTKAPATAADVTTGLKVEVKLDLSAGAQGGTGNGTAGSLGTASDVTVVP